MSVMAEMSHSAMGPYVSMAALWSVLYAPTAVCREALVMKVPGGDDGGVGGAEGGDGGEGGKGGDDGSGGDGGGEGGGGDGGGTGGGDGGGGEGGGDGGGGCGGEGGDGDGDEGGVIPTYCRRPWMSAAWRSSMASSSLEQPQVGGGERGDGEGDDGSGEGPVVTVRSIAGKNCGGTAPEPRWRVVKSELVFNECLTVPSSGPMSVSLSARMPGTAFACMFTRETREPGGMGGRK